MMTSAAPAHTRHATDPKPARRRALHPRDITDAERRVLKPLSEGLCDKQIGIQLGLAKDTVKSHLTRISRRWNVQGRIALLAAAYRHGELPLPEGPELLALRSALREVARLAGIPADAEGLDLEAVIPALRTRLAVDAGTTVHLPPDWRTQVESYPTWTAGNVIELVEEWQKPSMTAKTCAWTPDPDDHVEWNPARDVWKPAVVERVTISRTGTVVRIVLDATGQPLVVGLEHLRPSPAVPAAEQTEPVLVTVGLEVDGQRAVAQARARDGETVNPSDPAGDAS